MMVCHTLTHAVSLCVCVLSCQWEVDSADVVGAEKERVWRSVSAWINQSIIRICLITSLPLNGMKEGQLQWQGEFCLCTQDRGVFCLCSCCSQPRFSARAASA